MTHALLVLVLGIGPVLASAWVPFASRATLRCPVGAVSTLLIVVIATLTVVMNFAGVHATALTHPLTADVLLLASFHGWLLSHS
jgi:hypothetical protein